MRYYIDVGIYNGELLEKVVSVFPAFNSYIGFEAIPELCKRSSKRFEGNDKISIINSAVSTVDKNNVKFYVCYCKEEGGCKGKGKEIGTGSTLVKKKGTANIRNDKFIYVNTINFSKYIIDNFNKDDEIVLKMDIEGKEYDVLEHMIKTKAIKYIKHLYCEWHVSKFKKNKTISRNRHNKLVKKLQRAGLNIMGKNIYDELSYLIEKGIDYDNK